MPAIVVKGNVYVEQSSLQTEKALRVFRSLSEIDAGPDSIRCASLMFPARHEL